MNIVYGNRTVNGSRVDGYSTVVEYNPFPRNGAGDLENLEMVVFAAFQQRSDLKSDDWTAAFTSKGDPISIHYTLGPEQRIEKHNRWAEDLPSVRLFSGKPKDVEYSYWASYIEAEPTRRVDFLASRTGAVNSHLDGSMWISTLDGHLVALHSHSPDEELDDGTRVETDTVRQEESSQWLGVLGSHFKAVSIANIGSGVERLMLAGSPGTLSCSPDWQPIVVGESDSEQVFAAVRAFGKGRVAMIADEALIRNLADPDDQRFLGQMISWLSNSHSANVAFLKDKKTWVTLDQYGFAGENLSPLADQDVGVLVIGNAWESFTPDEIEAVTKYVNQGGGLLLAGLGWSWQQEHQGISLDDYPMNTLASPFGGSWGKGTSATPKGASGEVSLKVKSTG